MPKKEEINSLAEIKENEGVKVEVFIPQVYQTVIYFCQHCKKISGRMCDCGNFPEPTLKISGMISDGTKTIPFETSSEKIAEMLSGTKKINAEKVKPQDIMKKPHIVEGRIDKNKFWIEKVL